MYQVLDPAVVDTRRPLAIGLSSMEGRRDLLDDPSNGDAFGTTSEAHSHAMPQHRRRQGQHIIDRRAKPTIDQGSRATRKHQGLASARSRSPRNKTSDPIEGGLIRPAGAHQRKNRFDHALTNRD